MLRNSDTASRNTIGAVRLAAARPDGWLPHKGAMASARRAEKRGWLKECGFSVMPPNVLFVITDAGREALAAAQQ